MVDRAKNQTGGFTKTTKQYKQTIVAPWSNWRFHFIGSQEMFHAGFKAEWEIRTLVQLVPPSACTSSCAVLVKSRVSTPCLGIRVTSEVKGSVECLKAAQSSLVSGLDT